MAIQADSLSARPPEPRLVTPDVASRAEDSVERALRPKSLGDYVGQFMLPSRYPVGVITGAIGAPFLIYLIVRSHRTGGSL